ncbi:hypothetical protein MGMO_216c00020 [Methyloglobulus morosus KoM1]|uniref:Uncharacterized protein n=1 Tax=Methyloglobulus morosus KoM1 TaxID=1116472 RepID=V5BIW8_9GAMM|nr:hypothetical protein MGMO_216c00020 [Methyloglobulus morosus KoM1]
MEKQNFALESIKNIQELIRFIDQKSGAVLLVSGLIMTAFLEFSKELIFNFKSNPRRGFHFLIRCQYRSIVNLRNLSFNF